MAGHDWADRYEAAIKRFQQRLTRAGDGTFRLEVEDAASLGVDAIIFADLKRSLDVTNEKIRRKEIDPEQVGFWPKN